MIFLYEFRNGFTDGAFYTPSVFLLTDGDWSGLRRLINMKNPEALVRKLGMIDVRGHSKNKTPTNFCVKTKLSLRTEQSE